VDAPEEHSPQELLRKMLLRSIFRLVERRPHSSSEDCEIDTQHNPSTSLFEITYTLLTLVGFFWDSMYEEHFPAELPKSEI